MRKTISSAAMVIATVAASLGFAVPASAGTIVVPPGASIQDAVAVAQPGDTIQLEAGVYEDVVVVRTNDITIQGVGGGTDGTVLRPPAELPRRCFGGIAGICVFGDRQTGIPVDGVTVTGLRAEGFPAVGILAILARNTTFQDDVAADNGEYGLAAFESSRTTMLDNVTSGNVEAGLYVGDSPQARATIAGNESFGNGFGIFLREARHGDVTANDIHDNCAGILFLDEPGFPRAGSYTVSDNHIHHNSAVCEGDDGAPFGGLGIALAGGQGNLIRHNLIARNRAGGPSFLHGGVALFGGLGPPPEGNQIVRNDLLRNRPNVASDGSGSGNVIRNNTCTPHC